MKDLSKHDSERDCDDLILKTIDKVLIEVFGERSAEKIRQTMKENYALDWDDIPERSHVFSQALGRILGIGSMIIEDLIVENLYLNLGLELTREKDFSFSDYVAKIPSICKAGQSAVRTSYLP